MERATLALSLSMRFGALSVSCVCAARRARGEKMIPGLSAILRARVLVALFVTVGAVAGTAVAAAQSFIGGFNSVTSLGTTVPMNGDENPYGVAWGPVTQGKLVAGQFLVSRSEEHTS